MSRPKIKKTSWERVTNELVCSFALDDCPRCKGDGVYATSTEEPLLIDGGAQVALNKLVMCPCADAPFKLYYSNGRLRRNRRGQLEFRAVAMDVVP